MRLPKEHIYTFIDSQNLYLGVKAQGWELDYRKFKVWLADKLNVDKAFLFIGYIAKNEKLYSVLRRFEYDLVFKPTVEYNRNKFKGNVDAELVLYAMYKKYKNYDKAVIISGDGDFYCVLKELVYQKKPHRLLIPSRKSQSSLLKEFGRYIIYIDKIREKVKKGGALYSAQKLNSVLPPT